ncbi:cytochrome c3 family protein [Pelovirga terrestris]|uniref:Cytochrome c3 family protein n=1 Tax=Pelovirga terrestris TaxID=2771352 RepID=A0A8J6UGS4_9BACT|nr:cytochrome c3 family protein [Pelovirga terrestris]MBD1400288.1 cytochrome c3 family protein [Pelovirga terrestris]
MYRKFLLILAFLLVGSSVAWAQMRFDHQAHVEEYAAGMDCTTCHTADAVSIIPDAETCLACHDSSYAEMTAFGSLNTHGPMWARNHGSMATGAAMDCNACHSQSYCMECHVSGFADEQGSFSNHMMNSHSSDFHITHPLAARGNQQTCASCHEPSFCTDCHSAFNRTDLTFDSHRRGFSDISVGNNITHEQFNESQCQTCHTGSVLPSHQWSGNHAREARKNLATCQSCHPQGDVCMQCHSAKSGLMISPHPSNWGSGKNRLDSASGGRTCRVCH